MRNKAKQPVLRRKLVHPSPLRSSPSRLPADPSEKRFRQLIQDLQVGVVLLDPDSRVVFANETAFKIAALSKSDVVGKNTEEIGLRIIREDGTEVPMSMRPAPGHCGRVNRSVARCLASFIRRPGNSSGSIPTRYHRSWPRPSLPAVEPIHGAHERHESRDGDRQASARFVPLS